MNEIIKEISYKDKTLKMKQVDDVLLKAYNDILKIKKTIDISSIKTENSKEFIEFQYIGKIEWKLEKLASCPNHIFYKNPEDMPNQEWY